MKKSKLARIYGVSVVVLSYLVLFSTFLAAYFYPSKTVTITINTFGEANLELALLILAAPCVFLFYNDYIWELSEKHNL